MNEITRWEMSWKLEQRKQGGMAKERRSGENSNRWESGDRQIQHRDKATVNSEPDSQAAASLQLHPHSDCFFVY